MKSLYESITNYGGHKILLYHISNITPDIDKSQLEKIEDDNLKNFMLNYLKGKATVNLTPRIPDVKSKEDKKTPRICFSTDLGACVRHAAIHSSGPYFVYVYEASPGEITVPTNTQVPDAWATTEVWITKPVTLKYFGEVIIHEELSNGLNYNTRINNYYDMSFTIQ